MKQNRNLIFQKNKIFITNVGPFMLENSNNSKVHKGKKMYCPTIQRT